ncbi:MAG: hypothetical protein ABJA80_11265 [bacterium]
MRLRVALLGIALALPSLASTGCRSGGAYEAANVPDGVGLVVRNDNSYDLDVYAVADGLATRIGNVNGISTREFSLSGSMYGAADFRIVATPIGGNGRASTGSIVVSRGSTVYFTIGPVLRQSTVSIR